VSNAVDVIEARKASIGDGAGLLAHLPVGLSEINLSPAGGRRLARFFVIGGVPFGEPLLMWWNFVARNGEEITRAREDWVAGRFPRYMATPDPRSLRLRCLPYPSGPADPKASGLATP
jgi:hypothetical protein